VWYYVLKKEYETLETVDEMFYRRLLDVPIFTLRTVSILKEGVSCTGGILST
jgi:hypothetical protein